MNSERTIVVKEVVEKAKLVEEADRKIWEAIDEKAKRLEELANILRQYFGSVVERIEIEFNPEDSTEMKIKCYETDIRKYWELKEKLPDSVKRYLMW